MSWWLVCGIILGNLQLGIACGVAMQLVYIALVTPGGTVSADVRAISYIGIPLAMVAIASQGLNPLGGSAANLAKSVGTWWVQLEQFCITQSQL
ncbi:PTS sugar transporter subunit IIC [Lactiplantibacillus plantarum]|uniref:PTS sugar transporter subunit IIC n=1 Tax=Lactiplantibacillus plantarum TaxID=1590 RepID=UPI0021CB639E|nr:PTS sugar transporter subunit IIC [Lactiplantibacillus plantarum]